MVMVHHELKINSWLLDWIVSGTKTFEIRYDDRDYQVGDIISFIENERYDGTERRADIKKKITYIHAGLGMKENYVVLSLGDIKEKGGADNGKC